MAQRTKRSAGQRTSKATRLLREDHKKVKGIFAQFEKAESFSVRRRLCEEAIFELQVHSKIEEEIFYPAAREHLGEEELMAEAKEEHHVVDLLIAELREMNPGSEEEQEEFSAKFTVLAENVKHHIEEEEGEMFPKADKADMDHEELAERMAARKKELQARM
jgi:hemerythrin-like domain-containing protein